MTASEADIEDEEADPGPPEVRVVLILRGKTVEAEFDPDEATRRLGLTPTSTFRVGQQRPNAPSGVTYRRNGWTLESERLATWDASAMVEDLVARIAGARDAIAALVADHDLTAFISCRIHPRGTSTPGFVLSPATLAWMAAAKLELDVDVELRW